MDKLAYIPLVLISILSLVWGANKRGPEKPECLEVGINIDADSIGYDADTVRLFTGEDVNFYTNIETKDNAEFTWELEAGIEKKGTDVYHRFRKTGIYKITLVNGTRIGLCKYNKTIKVVPVPPVVKRPKTITTNRVEPAPVVVASVKFKVEQDKKVVTNTRKKLLLHEEIEFKAYGEEDDGWYWDFGDGTKSSSHRAVHKFKEEGKYKVTLKSDNYPDWDTTVIVRVSDDVDRDGIVNFKDECPYLRGGSNSQGCPDADGDGVPDYRDNCPHKKGSREKPYWVCPSETKKPPKPVVSNDVPEKDPYENNYEFPEGPLLNYTSADKPFGMEEPCEEGAKELFRNDQFDVLITPTKNIRIDNAYLYSNGMHSVWVQLLTTDDVVLKSKRILIIKNRAKLSFKKEFYCKAGVTYKLRVIPIGDGLIQYSLRNKCSVIKSPHLSVDYENKEVGLYRINYQIEKK